ncbi:MAG: hypothetical protein AAF304_05670 [Pseudomonadota bacterium]
MKNFIQQIAPNKRMFMWRTSMPSAFASCTLHAAEIGIKQVINIA